MLHARRASGQSLVLVAIMLPFLVAFTMTVVEIGGRMLQRAEVEDALRQASRSSVQLVNYAGFADNLQIGAAAPCQGTTKVGGGCHGNEVAMQARTIFIVNLENVSGLTLDADQVADLVQWHVLPQGGSCPELKNVATFTTPAVCATLAVPMRGLVGWGDWTPHVESADTLDRFED